jgi:type IV fimbrial biogenesis protein FimT
MQSRGFSLVELIVAMAILAIFSSIAMPSYLGWRQQAKLNDAAMTLRGDLETAKSHAMRRNEFVAVLFDSGGYRIFVDDGHGGGTAENWVRDGDEESVVSRRMPAGVTIDLTATTLADKRTRFSGRGWIGNTGLVRLRNTEGTAKIVDMSNRFGRVTTN